MKTGKDLYCDVHESQVYRELYSRQICKMNVRILLIPQRENPPTIKANKAWETCRSHFEDTRRKHLEDCQRGKYRETSPGNIDYRIQGFPHSTVQKEDSNRKEIVKILIQLFENHPLTEDLNKTEEFNPFSEKSKELITSMGNTEYFELCETSSEVQRPDCA